MASSTVDFDADSSWASSPAVRKTMRANRNRDTKPELAVRRASHRLGLRYRVSIRPVPELRRTADMVFPRQRVAVFVDGCFWHKCPSHFVEPKTHRDFWLPKLKRNVERDAETDALLGAFGWQVMRYWEHDDPERVAQEISQATGRGVALGQ